MGDSMLKEYERPEKPIMLGGTLRHANSKYSQSAKKEIKAGKTTSSMLPPMMKDKKSTLGFGSDEKKNYATLQIQRGKTRFGANLDEVDEDEELDTVTVQQVMTYTKSRYDVKIKENPNLKRRQSLLPSTGSPTLSPKMRASNDSPKLKPS